MLTTNFQNLQQENIMLLMIKTIQTIIKSNLCDYSDAYILVTGDITETGDHCI